MQLRQHIDTTPLCVELDGTVLRTTVLLEGVLALLRENPLILFLLPVWLWRGQAYFKDEVARRAQVDPAGLPYNSELLTRLREERAAGRPVELVTSANHRAANAISDHLGIFDRVTASTADRCLDGKARRDFLIARYGEGGFDYAGDAHDDLPVWRAARHAILVSPAPGVARRAPKVANVREVVGAPAFPMAEFFRALRPHQWTKNLLVFVPMILAHRFDEALAWILTALAFLAFSLCASAIYLLNDLLDAPADSRHPTKRFRPIAAGKVDRRLALAAVPALLVAGISLAALVSWQLAGILVAYLAATVLYSLILKRKMLWDVFTLAALYTLRIIAGAVAIDKDLSFWLLAFSVFVFLSLALVKRFVELSAFSNKAAMSEAAPSGRGYRLCDIETLHQVGIASCFSAVLVFALYINSEQVKRLYATSEILWLICPALLYLQLRVWLLARRDEMHEDPVVFALRDLRSQLVLLAIGLAMLGAKLWA